MTRVEGGGKEGGKKEPGKRGGPFEGKDACRKLFSFSPLSEKKKPLKGISTKGSSQMRE